MGSEDRVEREATLRRAVLAGDQHAWQTLYNETFDDLYAFVLWRLGGRRDRVDDAVQETWLTAVRRIRRFDPRQGSFLAWVRGVAANVVRSQVRGRMRLAKREQSANGQPRQGEPTQLQGEDAEREERIAAALDALPERQEAALRAKYLDGLSVAQIAEMWNAPTKTVESLLSRARQAFRNVYDDGKGRL